MELLTQRNKEIVELRKNRYKLREIGDKYNLTKERVRQIIVEQERQELEEKRIVDKLTWQKANNEIRYIYCLEPGGQAPTKYGRRSKPDPLWANLIN